MSTYRYTAKTSQGDETAGTIEASSFDEAIEQLHERGLCEIQVFAMGERESIGPQPPVSLTSREAGELSQHVAQVSTAKIPLAAGLRAASEETDSRRVAVALRWIADQIDSGRNLEEVLIESGPLMPQHVAGLILAASRTGSMGEALFELVELQQQTCSLRRELVNGFGYPLFVLFCSAAIMIFTGYYFSGFVKNLIDEFGMQMPMATKVMLWWRDIGIWLVGAVCLFCMLLAALYRLVAGPARWRRVWSTFPLFGPLWHWTGVAEWAGLLSVLLRHKVPLPEALRSAGRGTADAHIGSLSLRLADGVARGRSLSQMMFTTRELPSSLIPMIEWGEKRESFPSHFVWAKPCSPSVPDTAPCGCRRLFHRSCS